MAELKSEQKKELARDIYLYGNFTLEEIGLKVGTTRQTVARWTKAGKWDELKAGMTITREEILKNMYRQLNELNLGILQREAGERHASVKEADVLAKLSAAIKKMETDVGITDIISVGIRFGDWLRRFDVGKAKEYVGLWDSFIKEQIR